MVHRDLLLSRISSGELNRKHGWEYSCKGTIVRSCSRKSDVQAAKILNSRCREKGTDPPNPDVGFIDSKLESKYLGKRQTRKIERSSNEPPVSGQYINDRSILRKFDPLDSVIIERNFDFKLTKTDSTCSNYFKVKLEPEDSYNYVFLVELRNSMDWLLRR
eukprot:UN16228